MCEEKSFQNYFWILSDDFVSDQNLHFQKNIFDFFAVAVAVMTSVQMKLLNSAVASASASASTLGFAAEMALTSGVCSLFVVC